MSVTGGDCPQHGLIINTSNIELNCSDYDIVGLDSTSTYGVYVADGLTNVNVTECNISSLDYGIYVNGTNDGTYTNNTLDNNNYGAYLEGSASGNLFYYNNFSSSNTYQAYAESAGNFFNTTNGSSCGAQCARGNYWSDILTNNLLIADVNSDGWGDTGPDYPYSAPTGNVSSNVVDYGPQPAPFTDILTDCGELGIANKVYYLVNNVSSTGTCFNVTAENVTLRCEGYEINYSSAGALGYGVFTDQFNTTVRDCLVYEGMVGTDAKYGIYYDVAAHNGTIENNTVVTLDTNSWAVHIDDSLYNLVKDNNITTYGTTGIGIYLGDGDYANVTGNVIETSLDSASGITTSSSPYVSMTNNTIHTAYGVAYGFNIASSPYCTLRDNNVTTDSSASYFFTGTIIGMDVDQSNYAENLPVYYNDTVSDQVLFEDVDLSETYGQIIIALGDNVTMDNVTMGNDGIHYYSSEDSAIINSNITTDNSGPVYIYNANTRFRFENNTVTSTAPRYSYGMFLYIGEGWGAFIGKELGS